MKLLRATLLAAACLAAAAGSAAAQTASIRGTVIDAASRQPLAGVQVHVPGSRAGTLTDAAGRYLLPSVPAGTVRLRAEQIGYGAVERSVSVAAGQSATVDFELSQSAIALDEVVVVGYGTRSRREVSSSVATVNASEIANVPLAGVDAALQGKAAGVQITQNAGNPGNGITVRVRGASSISAGNQPLWVVDGVPILSDNYSQIGVGGQDITAVTGLSPDEIASIDILKDAAAASIYGSRGSNGVILVTTKRGQAGQPRFDFGVYFGQQTASKRLELLNAREYVEFFNEAATNDGEDPLFEAGVDDRISTDWQDAVLRSAPVANYQLGMSGGSDRVQYYLSGSYFDQDGIVVGSGYGRAAGRLNLDFAASDRLSLRASVGLSREDNRRIEGDGSNYGIITNTVGNPPLYPVRLEDGEFSSPDDGLEYPNPVALGLYNTLGVRTLRALGSLEAQLDVARGLRLTGRAGLDQLNLRELQYQSPRVIGSYPASVDGVAKSGYTAASRYLLESFLTYEAATSERHALTLTGGASAELNHGELNFVRGEGFTSERFRYVGNAAVVTDYDATAWENNLVSFFSRADYTLLGRYNFTASLRADGSSRFGPDNRYGVFPSASVGWIVTNEPFLQGVRGLDELKLRASYGATGNEAIGNFRYLGLFGSANYGDAPGLAPSSLGNPDLRWESTRETNLGFDLGLAGGRIGVIGDYYYKKTTDLLLARPVTATSGYTSVLDNVGNLVNQGVELALSTINVEPRTPDGFRWSTQFNISHNRNEVTKLFRDEPFSTGIRNEINRVEVGQPLGAFHVIEFLGVDPATGDAIYNDLDGDGEITAADRKIVGSPHPDYYGGLTNEFGFGGFDLRASLQFSQGNQVFNLIRKFSDAGGYYYDNQFADVMRRWQKPGDVTDVPRASYYGDSGATEISSRYIEDGSYIRLQDVTLGYRLPAAATRFARLQNARVYVSAQNLHTWTEYTGYNPDVNSSGAGATASLGTDYYAYPLARTLTIGITGTW